MVFVHFFWRVGRASKTSSLLWSVLQVSMCSKTADIAPQWNFPFLVLLNLSLCWCLSQYFNSMGRKTSVVDSRKEMHTNRGEL